MRSLFLYNSKVGGPMNKIDMYKREIEQKYGLSNNSIYMSDIDDNKYYYKDMSEKKLYKVEEIEEGVFTVQEMGDVKSNTLRGRRLLAKMIDFSIFYVIYILCVLGSALIFVFYSGPVMVEIFFLMSIFFICKNIIFSWINLNNRTLGDVIVGIYKVNKNNEQLTQKEYSRSIYVWPMIFPVLYPVFIFLLIINKDIWNDNSKYLTNADYMKIIKEDENIISLERPIEIYKSIALNFLLLSVITVSALLLSFNIITLFFFGSGVILSFGITIGANVLRIKKESKIKSKKEGE